MPGRAWVACQCRGRGEHDGPDGRPREDHNRCDEHAAATHDRARTTIAATSTPPRRTTTRRAVLPARWFGLVPGNGWVYRYHMFGVLLWLPLFILCWPLAILALVLWPVIWLLTIPFRILGIGVEAVFELLRAILFLPARLLGGRRYY